MKRITTILCCFSFMVSGIMLALNQTETPSYKTAMASIPFNYNLVGKMPLDLQLDMEKRQKNDTVFIHDTIKTKVNNIKYVKVPERKHTTDTLYKVMPMPSHLPCMSVSKNIQGDREEYTPVVLQSPKPSSVILTVDGQIVYSTENDIHSTEDR